MKQDVGPDVWVVVVRQDRVEAVNADTGERRWGEEAARLVQVFPEKVPARPQSRAWVPGFRLA